MRRVQRLRVPRLATLRAVSASSGDAFMGALSDFSRRATRRVEASCGPPVSRRTAAIVTATRRPSHERDLPRARLSRQPARVRPRAAFGRRLRRRGRRPPLRVARRRAQGLARRLPADRLGDRRGRARMGGAPLPGADVDRPAGGGGRGARDAGGARARALRHPGHLGAHRLSLPRQGGDEGGAAEGGGADGGLGRDLQRRARRWSSSRRWASR